MDFAFEAEIWQYDGPAAWCFVTLPPSAAAEIAANIPQREFGMVKIQARVGSSRWTTSLFKDNRKGTWLLPLKASIRRQEGLRPGERIWVELRVNSHPPASLPTT